MDSYPRIPDFLKDCPEIELPIAGAFNSPFCHKFADWIKPLNAVSPGISHVYVSCAIYRYM